jgi:PAS domain S-box-containing protein
MVTNEARPYSSQTKRRRRAPIQQAHPPLQGLGVGCWEWDIRTSRVKWTPEIQAMYGIEERNRFEPSIEAFLNYVHEGDRAQVMAVVSETLALRRPCHEQRFRILRADGTRHVLSRARLELDRDGNPAFLRGIDIDLTGQISEAESDGEAHKAYLLRLEESLRSIASPRDLIMGACKALGEELGVARVGFGEIEAERESLVVENEWRRSGMPAATGRHRFADYGLDRIAPALSGKTSVSEDILSDLHTADPGVQASFAALQVRSVVEMPLLREGLPRALLFVADHVPRRWSETDIALIRETLERTWHATERVRSEANLRASEEKYRSLFDSIDEGFCIVDMLYDEQGKPADYRFLEVNNMFEQQTGMVNAVGRTARELVPGLEQWWIDTYGEVGLTGNSARFEHGSASMGRFFNVYAVRVGGEASRKVAVVFSDITERKRAEEALRQSEAFNRSVFEASPDCVKIIGLDGSLEQMNGNGQKCMEIDDFGAICGSNWQDLWPNESRPDIEAALARAKAGEIGHFSGFCPTAKGTAKWWDVIVTAVPAADGTPVHLVASSRDITERRRDEEALRESAERLRLAAEAAGFGVYEFDPVTRQSIWSNELFGIFGIERRERVDVSKLIATVHPDDREDYKKFMDQPVEEENGNTYEHSYRIIRPSGEVRWVAEKGRVEFTGEGENRREVKTRGTIVDFTHRKQHEEHAELLMQEVNHRAKNLLAVVQAVARQTARSDPQLFAEQFGKRLAGLAASHDLLVRSEWRGVDLDDLLRSQLAHFAGLIGSRIILQGPRLQITPSAAQAIGMAIHELATNAGKHGALSTAEGSVRIGWALQAAERFTIEWRETDGPPCAPPNHRGFGHTVIVNMAKHALDADVSLSYPESGLAWRLDAAAERMLSFLPVAGNALQMLNSSG